MYVSAIVPGMPHADKMADNIKIQMNR